MSEKANVCFWCGQEADHHCYNADGSYSCMSCCLISTDCIVDEHDFSTEARDKWLDAVRFNLWRLQGIKENESLDTNDSK